MARSRKFLTVGALGVAAVALVAAGAGTTGAYFTDSHGGTINASTGSVVVNPTSSLDLNFTNLLPGEFQTNRVTYTAAGTGSEDIWLVFTTPVTDTTNFLSAPAASGPAPLGSYGHFALASNAGSFTSYNLASNRAGDTSTPCGVDTQGHGGSEAQATPGHPVPYCPVPQAILLSNNLTYGQEGYADVTFGFTNKLTSPQGSAAADIAPYKIVATQHGILPSDPNN
jgi:hypothetical protein